MPDFCARLNEHEVVLLRLLFSLRCGDLALIVQVRLVANQDNDDVVASLASDVVDPFACVLKRLFVCDVVDDDGHAGVADVRGDQGAEPLLAGRVP